MEKIVKITCFGIYFIAIPRNLLGLEYSNVCRVEMVQNLTEVNCTSFLCSYIRILKHPHIVQFYGIYLDMSSPMSTRVIFVMEKCKGNLRNHIFRELESTPGRSENATTVEEVRHWVKQIIDGLAHIHELGVVHRDLKLENILV